MSPQQKRSPFATVLFYLGGAILGLYIPAIVYQVAIMGTFAAQESDPGTRVAWLLNIGGMSLMPVVIGMVLIIAGLCLPKPRPH